MRAVASALRHYVIPVENATICDREGPEPAWNMEWDAGDTRGGWARDAACAFGGGLRCLICYLTTFPTRHARSRWRSTRSVRRSYPCTESDLSTRRPRPNQRALASAHQRNTTPRGWPRVVLGGQLGVPLVASFKSLRHGYCVGSRSVQHLETRSRLRFPSLNSLSA